MRSRAGDRAENKNAIVELVSERAGVWAKLEAPRACCDARVRAVTVFGAGQLDGQVCDLGPERSADRAESLPQ